MELATSFRLLVATCDLGLQVLNNFIDVLLPESVFAGVVERGFKLNKDVTARLEAQGDSEVRFDLLSWLKFDQSALTLLGLQLIGTSLLRQEGWRNLSQAADSLHRGFNLRLFN